MTAKKSRHIGEGVDRLVTLDLGGRGIIYGLYESARKITGDPLTLTAAKQITEKIKPNDTVIITTGFIIPNVGMQETDGPLGASSLARALKIAFKVRPLILIEEDSKDIMTATLQGVGLTTIDEKKANTYTDKQAVRVMSYPTEIKSARRKARMIFEDYKPSLVVSIEKAGRNEKGQYHTMRGVNITSLHAKIESLIEEAHERDVLTVGVGDGGNEVGMGNIKETVEKNVPYARVCQCSCQGGIAAESKVDVLVTSTTSNWGCYGIEACLAHLTNEPVVLHSPQLEEAMLRSAVDAGAVDGVTGLNELSVDGSSITIQSCIMSMLHAFIQ